MGKPIGYYTDQVFDRLDENGPTGPVADWLRCTAIFAAIAGLVGWIPVAIVMGIVFGYDGNRSAWWVYLGIVAAEALPASAWAGLRIRRDWKRREGPWSPEPERVAPITHTVTFRKIQTTHPLTPIENGKGRGDTWSPGLGRTSA